MSFRAFMTAILWLLLHVVALACVSTFIEERSTALPATVGIVIWYLMTVAFSFHLVPIGARLVAFFLSSEEGSYVTESDFAELHKTYAARQRDDLMRQFLAKCRRGLPFIGDVIYLQWPLYTVKAATSAILTIAIEASKSIWTGEQILYRLVETVTGSDQDTNKNVVGKQDDHQESPWQPAPIAPRPVRQVRTETHGNLTRTIETVSKIEEKKIPKVDLVVDVEILLRLGVELGVLINAFPKIKSFNDPQELQEAFSTQLQSVVDEAIRGAASLFTWNGTRHINNDRQQKLFEAIVIIRLREPKSGFVKSGLLEVVAPKDATEIIGRYHAQMDKVDAMSEEEFAQLIAPSKSSVANGKAAAGVDVAFEDVRPASPELVKAISGLAEASYNADAAAYEALATQRRERGLTDALVERAEKLGVEGELPLVTDAIKGSGGSLFLGAADFFGAASLLQKGKKSLKTKGKNPAGGQKPPAKPKTP